MRGCEVRADRFCAVVSSDECRTPIRAEALASVEHPEVVANTLRCTRKRRSQAWAPARVELRRLDDLDRTIGLLERLDQITARHSERVGLVA